MYFKSDLKYFKYNTKCTSVTGKSDIPIHIKILSLFSPKHHEVKKKKEKTIEKNSYNHQKPGIQLYNFLKWITIDKQIIEN